MKIGKFISYNYYAKAFTLIELMVTLSIIVMMSVMIYISTSHIRAVAYQAKAINDISAAGKAVEIYKITNNDQIPIVQQPYVGPNPWIPSNTIIGDVIDGVHAYPAQLLIPFYYSMSGNAYPPMENGFTSQLFTGSTNANFFPALITQTANSGEYYYEYITKDCSQDALPPDLHHKASQFSDYLILANNVNATGSDPSIPYYTWIYDGNFRMSNDMMAVPNMSWPNNPDGSSNTYLYNNYIWNDCP